MKKVWKYITISFLLLLGLCCVGILYLFFVPGSSLFNITYINQNIIKESEKFDRNSVSRIEINSRAYDVDVYTTEEDFIYLKTHANSFGFVLTQNSNIAISSKIENNVLKFDIDEPYGFATKNTSYIRLYIPEDLNIDLYLTNKKAETTINSAVTINNFKYTTQRGDCEFINGTINGLITLNLGKGDFQLHSNVETNNNNVNISLTSGSFKAPNIELGDVTITSNKRGIISFDSCENLRENQKSAGGQIYVNQVSHMNITAGDTIVSVKTVTNSATVNLTKSGSVKIDELSGISTFVTNSGNITLGKTLSPLTLQSESGNIKVTNAQKIVAVKVNYGEATIRFDENASSYINDNSSRVLYASVYNGKLTASGVEHIGRPEDNTQTTIDGGVKITGNGRIYLNMKEIYGLNTIAGNNGNVHCVINKNSIYTLKTSSVSGSVRVNLTQIPEFGGYTTRDLRTTNVNCISSSNLLQTTTNHGNLTILDTNFA